MAARSPEHWKKRSGNDCYIEKYQQLRWCPKYGLHLPLHRQGDVYQREGIDLDVSTLADWVGASAVTLMPLVDAIRSHVFAAERIHADDSVLQEHTERMIEII
ncbi:transposase [Bradyrhizobium sp. NBAIM18]|uniref:IS66 family transposase n=1 Tax=Bradyrhizobium sp. NBAIM18 TaxID=2793812 RepID=UPI003211EC5D